MAGDYKSNCTCVENTFHSLTFSTFWETASAFSSHRYYARFFLRSLATYPTYNIQRERDRSHENRSKTAEISHGPVVVVAGWLACGTFAFHSFILMCRRRVYEDLQALALIVSGDDIASQWWRLGNYSQSTARCLPIHVHLNYVFQRNSLYTY